MLTQMQRYRWTRVLRASSQDVPWAFAHVSDPDIAAAQVTGLR